MVINAIFAGQQLDRRMTAMSPPEERTEEAFHVARSRVVDAFGEVEREILALLQSTDAKLLKAPMSQKIAALRKVEPSPRYARKRRDAVHASLDELALLLARRAEIAHSVMQIVHIIGEPELRAGFHNPATQAQRGECMLLYRVQDLVDLSRDVRALARELSGPLTPASSPPRPSQA